MESNKWYVRSFRDLDVYKISIKLSDDIFAITKRFPKEEIYSLTDQIRRSSRSVGAQIAEAWGKRRYEKHFVSKLTDADAEQLETQHWIEVALNCLYISVDERNTRIEQRNYIGKMIYSMTAKSKMFCGGSQNETDH
ncbi:MULTISPECIES: four helix bundle protein [unclassified Imperialibacter]|uniref:four helix bundle protein n=1 Tax=unclassified Imperialibacter TaxID=2629706 RepID=UPI00125C5242|nr:MULTISPECIES: four helix bundle protein [unclassified Imperialibacter]CAD5268143.1 Four helix bundle protein [Imperialibacter sp. 75]CAD5280725.1 Four helix bundle protein [Imperialibacter sp. 89]VVT01584.1 Four helix bundle protein [Imperialibacter sp. EC-SDR9]